MSLMMQQAMKLRAVSPLAHIKRNKHGWPGVAYFPGKWGLSSHVITRAPTVHIPFQRKMFFGCLFLVGMFSYPYYVTYKMYDWDRLDENM